MPHTITIELHRLEQMRKELDGDKEPSAHRLLAELLEELIACPGPRSTRIKLRFFADAAARTADSPAVALRIQVVALLQRLAFQMRADIVASREDATEKKVNWDAAKEMLELARDLEMEESDSDDLYRRALERARAAKP